MEELFMCGFDVTDDAEDVDIFFEQVKDLLLDGDLFVDGKLMLRTLSLIVRRILRKKALLSSFVGLDSKYTLPFVPLVLHSCCFCCCCCCCCFDNEDLVSRLELELDELH